MKKRIDQYQATVHDMLQKTGIGLLQTMPEDLEKLLTKNLKMKWVQEMKETRDRKFTDTAADFIVGLADIYGPQIGLPQHTSRTLRHANAIYNN